MRIWQILATISYGDAVGNDAFAIYHLLKEKGCDTAIYAEGIQPKLRKTKYIYSIDRLSVLSEDIIIYHLSTGTRLNFLVDKYPCHKILIYHNITPSLFFAPYNLTMYNYTYSGNEGMKYLANKVDYCLADSEFNKKDLIKEGYQCPIDVRPILIPFHDYEKTPSLDIIKQYKDGWVNIIFVGRIAPNKKQEDVIKAFYYYKNYMNPNSRLILVGSYEGMEKYYERLKNYISALNVHDVIFTGHIKFEEILAYYKIADIFLCMSEHEGFCVPLVEAMYFNVPIIAFRSTAIPDTLSGSGVLVEDKDPVFIGKLIDQIVSDQSLRDSIIAKQKIRLNDFSYENVSRCFQELLMKFLERENEK